MRNGPPRAEVGDAFVDFAAVYLITTATLDVLAQAHPGRRMDARRFRAEIDAGDAADDVD